jgi:DNA polymerase III delta subunit
MQLRFDALDGHLAKTLAPLYVITSDEHLLALEAADKVRRAAKAQGFYEREILTVERSFKWGALLAANQSQSLFGDKKLIDLRIPTGKPGKDGGQALQDYVANLSPDNLTLITCPSSIGQRKKQPGSAVCNKRRCISIFRWSSAIIAELDQSAPRLAATKRGPAKSGFHRRSRRRQSACCASGNTETRFAASGRQAQL